MVQEEDVHKGRDKRSKVLGGRAAVGVLVQDLFGQGADEGLAPELTAVVPFGAEDDLVDMEGAFGGNEYVIVCRAFLLARRGLGAIIKTRNYQ